MTNEQNLLVAAKIAFQEVGHKRIEGADQNPMGWRDLLYSAIIKCDPTWKPRK